MTANKLPQPEKFKELNAENDFKSANNVAKNTVSNMLNKFLTLQTLLLKQYGETKTLLLKGNKKEETKEESDEEIPSDTEEEKDESDEEEEKEESPKKKRKLSEFESDIKLQHEKYKNYRNNIIQKWNDKTRLTLGKNNSNTNSVLQQIDYILNDKNKLTRRTQMKRSEYEILGKAKQEKSDGDKSKEDNEYDTEIFDDTDFYHQLLRELIEVKSGDVTDPVQMSRQWIALQNLRSKMKRKIDTRATKGRKIRYVVHSKLVNFMASVNDDGWSDEAKTELYSSLFGNKL